MKPKITVIVPVYKVEKYLDRCVESIVAQTFTDFELILVDDGSPDNCPAMCDEWAKKDSRIRVIHKENGGVSVARNTALDVACGKYVAFCDSDDCWEPNLLEISVGVAETNNADTVVFNYATVNNDEILSQSHFAPGIYEFSSDEDRIDYIIGILLGYKHGWEMWDRLYRRDIIERQKLRCCTKCNNFAEDMGFVIKYALHSKRLCCITDCLYNYNLRSESMMRKSRDLIRLNDMNEVSCDVGKEFFNKVNDRMWAKGFSVVHFLIVYGQIQKVKPLSDLSKYIDDIQDKKWWKQNAANLRKSYKILKKYYGKENAQRTVLFSNYLMHGNWKRYSYESAIYYKFFSRG